MKKGEIYKGGSHVVYKQHAMEPLSVEYSLDNGTTWNSVPVDIGKINYISAWFRLKETNYKELHLWLSKGYPEKNTFVTLKETETALAMNTTIINTTQTHYFSTQYLEKGYRLFVHFPQNIVVEVKLGKNNRTNKEIRSAHNLEKLLLSGEFGFY